MTHRPLLLAALFLAMLPATPARAADAPATEQLPIVETGEEALKGDYLDLRDPAEIEGGSAGKKKPGRKVELRLERLGPKPPFLALTKGEDVTLSVTLVSGKCATLENKELKVKLSLQPGQTVEAPLKAESTGNFLLSCPGGKLQVGLQVK